MVCCYVCEGMVTPTAQVNWQPYSRNRNKTVTNTDNIYKTQAKSCITLPPGIHDGSDLAFTNYLVECKGYILQGGFRLTRGWGRCIYYILLDFKGFGLVILGLSLSFVYLVIQNNNLLANVEAADTPYHLQDYRSITNYAWHFFIENNKNNENYKIRLRFVNLETTDALLFMWQ